MRYDGAKTALGLYCRGFARRRTLGCAGVSSAVGNALEVARSPEKRKTRSRGTALAWRWFACGERPTEGSVVVAVVAVVVVVVVVVIAVLVVVTAILSVVFVAATSEGNEGKEEGKKCAN